MSGVTDRDIARQTGVVQDLQGRVDAAEQRLQAAIAKTKEAEVPFLRGVAIPVPSTTVGEVIDVGRVKLEETKAATERNRLVSELGVEQVKLSNMKREKEGGFWHKVGRVLGGGQVSVGYKF